MDEESIGICGGAPPRESQYDTREHNVAGGGRQPPFISLWRSHGIVFHKDLALHVSISILSITVPFALPVSLPWLSSAIPLSLWCFYVAMFMEGVEHPLHEQRGFGRFKCSAVAAMKILPPWLMPVLSLCFISVVTVMTLTAAMLGGSPLYIASCSSCLASWANAQPLHPGTPSDSNQSCGFSNRKELLAYHTFSRITITIYLALMLGLLIYLAWRVSDGELAKQEDAKERLQAQSPLAFGLREQMISEHGSPESRVHLAPLQAKNILGVLVILFFASISFTIMSQSSQNKVTTIIIGTTVTAGAAGVLVLHVSFYSSLIALHERNLNYVKFVSSVMIAPDADVWWKLRSFVIENDLPLNANHARPGFLATIAIVIVAIVFVAVKTAWGNLVISASAGFSSNVMTYMLLSLNYILVVMTKTSSELQSQGKYIELYVEKVIPTAKMIALCSRCSRVIERALRLMRAEDVLLPGTTNSSRSQEQPSITGVETRGENSHRDSSGDTENASSVMRRRRGGFSTGIRRMSDELNDLSRSPERAMRVVERSAAANATDATQEALRCMLERIKNEPNPDTLGIPIKTESLRMVVILSFFIYPVLWSVSMIKLAL